MSLSLFKMFSIFGTVSTWSEKALADGRVTLAEATDLGTKLAAQLGLPTEIEVFPDRPAADLSETPDLLNTGEGEP